MPAYAGPAPWSDGYKRISKKALRAAGATWDLAGYGTPVDPTGMSTPRRRRGQPRKMREITLHNGRKVQVPESDYNYYSYMTFDKVDAGQIDTEMSAYISKGFRKVDDPRVKRGATVVSIEGCGHIAKLEYSAYYTMLRVTFVTDGAVVVYFRVPSSVFGELYYLAQSKATSFNSFDGTERHALGVRFWDLIRIRGNVHGSRYRFAYTQEGSFDLGGFDSAGEYHEHYNDGRYIPHPREKKWVEEDVQSENDPSKNVKIRVRADEATDVDKYEAAADAGVAWTEDDVESFYLEDNRITDEEKAAYDSGETFEELFNRLKRNHKDIVGENDFYEDE